MAMHDVATLREFQGDGDSRLVFARASDGAVVWMPPGAAEEFRAAARSGELTCIVTDCENKRLKAINRGAKRHGFAHHAGAGGHSGMGPHHLQSQLLVARWLREKYPDAKIELEETTEDNQRRADVMFTSSTGRRAAFEIQYAGITPRAWEERHQAYRALGIVDIWLWGHTHPQLRRQRGSTDTVELNPTHEMVAGLELPLLWINPELASIGLVTTVRHSTHAGSHESLCTHGAGRFESEPLNAYRLTAEHGLTSDRLRDIRRTMARAQTRIDEGARRDAEEAQRRALKAENVQAFMERVVAKAEQRKCKWERDPARQQIIDDFGGHWPTFLNLVPIGSGEAHGTRIRLPYADEHWQGLLYMRFLRGRSTGTQVTIKECAAALVQLDPDVRYATEAVRSWFHQLTRRGVMAREEVIWTGGREGIRYVIGDLPARRADAIEAAARTEQERAEANAQFDQRQLRLDAFFKSDPVLMTVDELCAEGIIAVDARHRTGRVRCVSCNGAINDPPSIGLGYHTRCAPALSEELGHPLTSEFGQN